jgi:hypothetical protein
VGCCISGIAAEKQTAVWLSGSHPLFYAFSKIWFYIFLGLPSCRYILQGITLGKIVSPGMLRRVALVRTNVSKELSASVIRVTRIGELGT